MSDVQNGPDWWRASDGKWYPPQSRPAPPPPPSPVAAPPPGAPPPGGPPPVAPPPTYGAPPSAPPPAYAAPPSAPPPAYGAPPPVAGWPTSTAEAAGPSRISAGLSGTLQGFLWATGAMALIAGFTAFAARSAFSAIGDNDFESLVDWADREDALDGVTAFTYLLWIVVFVLLIIWAFKAHAVSRRLWSGQRRWSSGWTIGGWFIPAANFVIPKLVLNEIEKIASAPRAHNGASAGPQQGSTSAIGWGWWILLGVGLILTAVGQGMLGSDEDLLFSRTEDEILRGYAVQGLGLLCWAASCVLGALFVRRLGRRLSSPS